MIKQTVTCDRCGKDITKSYFFSCQMDSLNISGDTDCIPVKSFELCKDCADIIYNEITNNKSKLTPSTTENSEAERNCKNCGKTSCKNYGCDLPFTCCSYREKKFEKWKEEK